MADFSQTHNQVAFKLFDLVSTNAVITSSEIAYPEEDTMKLTLVVTVCSVHFGDIIITSRLVQEDDFAESDLSQSLNMCRSNFWI